MSSHRDLSPASLALLRVSRARAATTTATTAIARGFGLVAPASLYTATSLVLLGATATSRSSGTTPLATTAASMRRSSRRHTRLELGQLGSIAWSSSSIGNGADHDRLANRVRECRVVVGLIRDLLVREEMRMGAHNVVHRDGRREVVHRYHALLDNLFDRVLVGLLAPIHTINQSIDESTIVARLIEYLALGRPCEALQRDAESFE